MGKPGKMGNLAIILVFPRPFLPQFRPPSFAVRKQVRLGNWPERLAPVREFVPSSVVRCASGVFDRARLPNQTTFVSNGRAAELLAS